MTKPNALVPCLLTLSLLACDDASTSPGASPPATDGGPRVVCEVGALRCTRDDHVEVCVDGESWMDRGPCANGGACVDVGAGGRCDCAEGFAGERCETDVDDCADAPCANGGRCIDEVAGFRCDCADGFAGRAVRDRRR